MTWAVLSLDGKEHRTIELDDRVFRCAVSEELIYYAIRNELANLRIGTASTKRRGEVRGSGRKPWRQKGTGRARAGSRRSPIWVGGGVVFGPHPRDYSYKMPTRQKRQAMRSVLSLIVRDAQLRIVQDFDFDSGKTKDLVTILQRLLKPVRSVFILGDDERDKMIKRAARNIPWISYLSYKRLRAHDLFCGQQILIMASSVEQLNRFYTNDVQQIKAQQAES